MRNTLTGILAAVVCMFALAVHAEDNIEKSYDSNGKLKESFEQLEPKDGKVRGILRHYYTNGTLKVELPIIEAGGELGYAPDGIVKHYHPNGNLASSVQWQNEKRNGPFQSSYPSSDPRESGTFTNNTSIVAKRFDRTGRAIPKKSHLHVELDFRQITESNQVPIHIVNFHDGYVHLGWIFADKLIDKKWERIIKRGRGDSFEMRESKVAMLNKDDFSIGTWKIFVSYNVIGKPLKYIQSESQTFEIEQLNGQLFFNPRAD